MHAQAANAAIHAAIHAWHRTAHSWNVFHHWMARNNVHGTLLHGAIVLFVVWVFLTQVPILLLIAGRAVCDAVSVGTWIYRTVFENNREAP